MEKKFFSKFILSLALGISLFSSCTYAQIIGTEAVLVKKSEAQKETISRFLERDDVAKKLESLGVDAQTAKERVAALSDEEARYLAQKIDSLPAGGDAIVAIAVVFLVLVITDILGVTKVFSFTRTAR